MKLLRHTTFIFIALTIFILSFNRVYALSDLPEPQIDSGVGYAVGKTPEKTGAKTGNKVLDLLFKPYSFYIGESNSPTSAPTPTAGATPIIQPVTPGLTPGESNTAEGQFADRIVQIVHANCKYGGRAGIVASGNVGCLSSLDGVINQNAISEFRVSASSYQYLQCVGCARGMGDARNRPYNGYGNAKQHSGQRVSGYTYYANTINSYRENWANVTPGSMFILGIGAYGHIGYITEVYRDTDGRPTSFKAFECNYGGNGYVRHDKIWPMSTITGWQKPNSI